ncbi:MAG: prepilin-type N-terminal cleavage/methylation domain-containing protein [Deltaproteobacteria bacterium]|nr:prepilin-type N-terminal cleavage/methylation domain-containing protein [Deltaproteobacteria bacterium]
MHTPTSAHGFTLLELLVVIAIVSILSAIAVPQFNAYRQRSFDTRARQDLHNVAIAEEAYFLDYERYSSCANQSCTALPGISTLSKGVDLSITAEEQSFTGTATHPKGSGRLFSWDSEHGGLLESDS